MILILSPSANFCYWVLTSDKKISKICRWSITKSMTYSSDILCYEMDFFVAAKKFVAGIQFCRSATSFGSDNFFMKRPPGLVVTIFTFWSIYPAKEKSNTHNFFHETRWLPILMKISESFDIRVNILKILRSKQTQKIVTTYSKVGVSCHTGGKLLHLI